MNKFRTYLEKVLGFLRIRPRIGGLEVSDSFIRYVYTDGKDWKTAAARLAPNIVKNGKVVNADEFAVALHALHDDITKGKKRERTNVVVSLSSVNVYSQVFSLPVIEGENLEKAIQLNIQMVSPAESSQTYSGWQLVGEDQKSVRLEVLSSFINKEVVDSVRHALAKNGFVVHSIESRALSLARLLRQLGAGFDREKSYIMLSIDSTGIEFLIVRRAQLYFQYFNSWQDLYGGDKQITKEAFETAVTRNLHQVFNFYNSHWSEPLSGIFISTTALQDQVRKVITENFSLTILEMQLNLPEPVNPDWFVPLGASLRGLTSQKEDKEISLLGMSAQDEFRENQASMFVEFWRLVLPVSLAIIVGVFVASYLFLSNMERNLELRTVYQSGGESKEIADLQTKVSTFNHSATLLSAIMASVSLKVPVEEKIFTLALAHGVTVNHLVVDSNNTIALSGSVSTEDGLKDFEAALNEDGEFGKVAFSLSDIRTDQNGVSFSFNFPFTPSKTP